MDDLGVPLFSETSIWVWLKSTDPKITKMVPAKTWGQVDRLTLLQVGLKNIRSFPLRHQASK